MKFGDPVILTDSKGVEHPNAWVWHTTAEYPDWARVLVTDIKRTVAPPMGDHDIPTLIRTETEFVVIAERKDKPVPGWPSWRPVPTQNPMSEPAAKPAKIPKGV